MLKAVLIDVGGTLVDDHDFYELADRLVLELLAESGRLIPREEYERVVQGFIVRLYPNPCRAALWHLLKPDLEGFRRLQEELQRRSSGWKAERLQPGAREAIVALSEHYKLALAGNQPATIKEFLRASGVLEYFHFQLVSEEMGVTKPDPVFFQIILDSLGAEPKEAVMVGDRLDYDIFPAKLIGLRTVRVLVGPYAAQEPPAPAYEPELTIPSLGELPEAMGRLEPAQ
jgi:putative hydrolase of the HAD superfamily